MKRLLQIKKSRILSIFELDVTQSLVFCSQQLLQSDFAKKIDFDFQYFKELVQEGETIIHRDSRIKELFNECKKTLWIFEVNRIRQTSSDINPILLLKLHEQAEVLR